MKIYIVDKYGNSTYDRTLKDLIGDGTNEGGGRLLAISNNWPRMQGCIHEGGIGTLDLERNEEGNTLMVSGLFTCSAIFYLYINPLSDGHGIAAALAFHAPSGTRLIKLGDRKGERIGGPIAEADRLGYNVKPNNVFVVIAAGPDTMKAHNYLKNAEKQYKEKAIVEHSDFIDLFQKEEIPSENIVIYCSSQGEFGLSANGCFGERAMPRRVVVDDAPKKKRCYISTATLEALGLPDDCQELELLRWYRDHILMRAAQGQHDVQTYYATAPAIVAAIDAQPDATAIYQRIYSMSLAPAIAAIRSADYDRAYSLYRELVSSLQARYGIR